MVLTSARTISAAEIAADALKATGRAKIVGEKTPGGLVVVQAVRHSRRLSPARADCGLLLHQERAHRRRWRDTGHIRQRRSGTGRRPRALTVFDHQAVCIDPIADIRDSYSSSASEPNKSLHATATNAARERRALDRTREV